MILDDDLARAETQTRRSPLTRIARHAGTNDATSDTPTRTAGAAMNVAGSSGETA